MKHQLLFSTLLFVAVIFGSQKAQAQYPVTNATLNNGPVLIGADNANGVTTNTDKLTITEDNPFIMLQDNTGNSSVGIKFKATAATQYEIKNYWSGAGMGQVFSMIKSSNGFGVHNQSSTLWLGGLATVIPATYVKLNAETITINGNSVFAGATNTVQGKLILGDFSLTTPGTYRLYVQSGGILTERIKVALKTSADWSDYVFEENYKLMPLAQVENYINMHNHLPEVPSADDVVKEGLDLAVMDATLLKKIEELTLYTIELNKQIESLNKEIVQLKKSNKK